MKFNSNFVKYRISKDAYTLLMRKIKKTDKEKIYLKNNTVYISKKIFNDYHAMFSNNAKTLEKRIDSGKLFHHDHNPSNKKVLNLLKNKIKSYKEEDGFLEELIEYIKTVQTIDLITIYEDSIRTTADRKSAGGSLSSRERDKLLKTSFYCLQKITGSTKSITEQFNSLQTNNENIDLN